MQPRLRRLRRARAQRVRSGHAVQRDELRQLWRCLSRRQRHSVVRGVCVSRRLVRCGLRGLRSKRPERLRDRDRDRLCQLWRLWGELQLEQRDERVRERGVRNRLLRSRLWRLRSSRAQRLRGSPRYGEQLRCVRGSVFGRDPSMQRDDRALRAHVRRAARRLRRDVRRPEHRPIELRPLRNAVRRSSLHHGHVRRRRVRMSNRVRRLHDRGGLRDPAQHQRKLWWLWGGVRASQRGDHLVRVRYMRDRHVCGGLRRLRRNGRQWLRGAARRRRVLRPVSRVSDGHDGHVLASRRRQFSLCEQPLQSGMARRLQRGLGRRLRGRSAQ